ncbi:hypothetical protein [Micromonospora sp. L32]|uniref:hypothetical protein n=1 Tax=Micromonospora sp. L32 TaxID=3452214 RepID=UPI003F8A4CBE
MATDEKSTSKPSATSTTRSSSAREATSGQKQDPTAGVAEQMRTEHERRITVPGAPNVDARLDNRTGDQRPPVESWPAKPQQVDGPDVMHQTEHTRRVLADRDRAKDAGERKGMFSPGPHGLSDERLREGGDRGETQTLYGTEGLTEAQAAEGNPTAG